MNETTNMIPTQAWQYGVLGVIAFVFGAVIWILFRLYVNKIEASEKARREEALAMAEERKAWAVERESWETERERIRLEYETKHRELANQFAMNLKELYDDTRLHEDHVRKEYGDMVEGMSEAAVRSSGEVVRVLDKIYERFIGPRARRY